ncbi:GRP family sugar transporter [Paenibacillus sp. A14]|uniref:GRP family sugar transporter n=1 Tax=Paenibacillus sp. A14 TaxID=3119820 RepID=UPI002FE122BA
MFIAFVSALGWGFMPILAQLTKAGPREQLLGTSAGAVLFAAGLYVASPTAFSPVPYTISFISGILWAIGQLLQFEAFQRIRVSTAIPFICGLQLTGTTLFAALALGEWSTRFQFLLGIAALALVLAGVLITSLQEESTGPKRGLTLGQLSILLCSALALTGYVIINQWYDITGLSVILPQSAGMFLSAVAFSLFAGVRPRPRMVIRNLGTGLSWSIANLALFIANGKIGVAASFPISQVSIVIATVGSILIFKEKKSRKVWMRVLLGSMALMAGVILIGLTKS